MKKLLSLILAIIMIVSTVPMAFAVEFDRDTYIDTVINAYTAAYNTYTADETLSSAEKSLYNIAYFSSVQSTIFNEYPELKDAHIDIQKLSTVPDAANAYMLALKEATDFITSQMTPVRINTKNYVSALIGTELKYGEEKINSIIEKLPEELVSTASQSMIDTLIMIYAPSYDSTQEDFDATAKDAILFYNQIDMCLSGNHTSENPTTDNGDGTHTFICAFCTDIATAEHSFIDGKCVCGVEEPVTDDGNDEVVEDKTETEDDNTNADDNTQEPEKTSFIKQLVQKISNFFKSILEKLRSLVKR